jgi:gluconate kinase
MKKLGIATIALFWAGMVILSGTSTANMAIQKSAKAAGIAADNCQYCHMEKMPKKDAVTMNDRGKWLVDQKAKKGAKEVDGAWLKDYKEAK